MKRIAVLFHAQDRDPSSYVVSQLAEHWRADGHRVEYLFGHARFVPADILLIHVNLSVVSDEYLRFTQRYPLVLNAKVRDIRKSRVSRNLLRKGDDWSGPVIVKSDLNYFGLPEQLLNRSWLERQVPTIRRLRDAAARLRTIGMPFGNSLEYIVLPHLDQVPDRWFSSQDIVVEKFRPELEDGRYHLRICQVLGDRQLCTRIASDDPVVKAHKALKTQEFDPPGIIGQWRREFGLDYGKLDFVISDGEAILLDVNKTTGATPGYRSSEALADQRRYLAEGLYSWFD